MPASGEQKPIALFPNELERDPESAWLRAGSGVLHDVLWDDPAVFETYYNRLLWRHPARTAKIASLLGVEDRVVEASA